jgi:hypothetical protein
VFATTSGERLRVVDVTPQRVRAPRRQSSDGRHRRLALRCESRRLVSTRRARAAREGRVATRGVSGVARATSLRRSSARAAARFICWLRCRRAVTTTPVGLCVSLTADSVLFWCCPPGPPALNVSTSHSASSAPSSPGGKGGGSGGSMSVGSAKRGGDGGARTRGAALKGVSPLRSPRYYRTTRSRLMFKGRWRFQGRRVR